MSAPTPSQSADRLFRRWLDLLASGRLATAADVAGGHPTLVPVLQARITDCLAGRAADLDATLWDGPAGTDTLPAPPDIPGYRFIEHLGRGGMGHVWLVQDEFDLPYALKIARTDRLSAAGLVRFHAEVRAMREVEHPYVVPVRDAGWCLEIPYFLMPVYPASLKDRLAEYQADPAKAVRLMAAVAEGVGALHARRLVHRDLKPANVLLTADGVPQVSDLGLAMAVGDHPVAPAALPPRESVSPTAAGTRAYMAPEQAAGLVHLANPKWDVFALGVMLHELLTGHRPRSSDAPEQLLNPAEPDHLPLARFRPGLEPSLDRIVRTCLARSEADRYPDGSAVASALRTWLAVHRPAAAAPRQTWWARLARRFGGA